MEITYGASLLIGNKPTQQDALFVKQQLFSKTTHLFAVMDGHGVDGDKVSTLVEKSLLPLFLAQESLLMDHSKVTGALSDLFSQLHALVANAEGLDPYMSGSTLVVAYVLDHIMYVANVGDSKCVITRETSENTLETIQLSIDHTCDDKTELDRVLSLGARVEQKKFQGTFEGPLRIFKGSLPYPGLTVSRSIGDVSVSNNGVLHEPSVTKVDLSDDAYKFAVLASDGVWDGLSPQRISSILKKAGYTPKDKVSNEKAHEYSKLVCNKAYVGLEKAEVDDNISNVIIFINH